MGEAVDRASEAVAVVGDDRRPWGCTGRRRRSRGRAGLPGGSAQDGRRARRLGVYGEEHAGPEFDPTAANDGQARHDRKSAGACPGEDIPPGRPETVGVGRDDANPGGAHGLVQPAAAQPAGLEHDFVQPHWNDYDIEFGHEWWPNTAHGSTRRVEHSPTPPASDSLAVETRRLGS
jgi:hypothetical protein